MEPVKLPDQNFLDKFGLGSILILLQGLIDPSLFRVFNVSSTSGQVPTSLALVVASIAFFLIFAAGKLAVIFGASLSGVLTYPTRQRYLDYLEASSKISEKNWALFSSLRRDLDFIDGILGIYCATLLTMVTTYFVSADENALLSLSVWSVLFMLLGIGMCLNGAWGNRHRVNLVISANTSPTAQN